MTNRSAGWRSHRTPDKHKQGCLIATWDNNDLSTTGHITDQPYNSRYNETELDAEDSYVPRPPIEVTYHKEVS